MTGYFGNSSMSNKDSNVYKEKLRILSKNFKLTPEQLSRLFNIPISKINNVKDKEMTNNEKEKIEYISAMLNYGLPGMEPNERVQILLDTLIEEFHLSISNIAKMINVEEDELINFKENGSIKKEIELKICVNLVMLNFILNQK
ncbi:HTH domain-containing protein [Heyndrickxia oleronia]|jgi:hypothetical protein|uniref:HTH domain-containing protein n=1 Tax=Heyndrickxia oleronia TaxID=38875 RepID=UPI00242FC879|nr:HTH domain-containing protein [Heyndrickxia oleronia]MCI1592863.1 hypothetical protein [Heyndrickxia oleronia]MCI1614511.1 hypothetical protein [Heyndrickxia oleronia]MCI1743344.1 hypothetical protein [Heyndrickxia oleronia]MCI1762382.1 hypothetical protein [Heyndrickxia oleronia]